MSLRHPADVASLVTSLAAAATTETAVAVLARLRAERPQYGDAVHAVEPRRRRPRKAISAGKRPDAGTS